MTLIQRLIQFVAELIISYFIKEENVTGLSFVREKVHLTEPLKVK